jgi:hypothetical protein
LLFFFLQLSVSLCCSRSSKKKKKKIRTNGLGRLLRTSPPLPAAVPPRPIQYVIVDGQPLLIRALVALIDSMRMTGDKPIDVLRHISASEPLMDQLAIVLVHVLHETLAAAVSAAVSVVHNDFDTQGGVIHVLFDGAQNAQPLTGVVGRAHRKRGCISEAKSAVSP